MAEHAWRLAEMERAALAASRAGVAAGDTALLSALGSPFTSPYRATGEVSSTLRVHHGGSPPRSPVDVAYEQSYHEQRRAGEWQAALPMYSRIIFASAPNLGLRGGGGNGVVRPSDLVPAAAIGGSVAAWAAEGPRGPSVAGAVSESLPGWLLMTLRMSREAVRQLFHAYEKADVRSVPMADFAGGLHRACGLELTQVEMSTLLRCLAFARGEEPPPLHLPLEVLRRAALDVALLGQAIQLGEKRSASDYLRRPASPEREARSPHRSLPSLNAPFMSPPGSGMGNVALRTPDSRELLMRSW